MGNDPYSSALRKLNAKKEESGLLAANGGSCSLSLLASLPALLAKEAPQNKKPGAFSLNGWTLWQKKSKSSNINTVQRAKQISHVYQNIRFCLAQTPPSAVITIY